MVMSSLAFLTQKVKELERKIDEQGKKIEEQGKKIEEQGKKIDEQGNKIEKLEMFVQQVKKIAIEENLTSILNLGQETGFF